VLAAVLAVVASAVFVARLLPQPLRLWRTGVDEGVSPMAAYNSVLSAVGWLVYGLAESLPAVWVVSLVALVPGCWQAALLVRRTRAVDVAGAALFAAVIAAAAVAGFLAPVLAVGVLVTAGPQVVEALRCQDLSGLAPATWWIAIGDAALWGLYGASLGDAALVGYWAVLTACAVVVLVRIADVRRRAPVEPVAVRAGS
jgi:uncharacterized protein with PQ loop repeat